MSNITDSRVVEMRFDNSNFEKNCKQTLNSLDQLDSSLKKFDGKNVNPFEGSSAPLAKMGEAIDNVKVKIDTMGLVFTNVLSDMVIRAERAGERFVKSLSIDQVAAGWEKYAEKTQAVQMIVNQGYDMAEVDAQLEKLNWFTDETSYSFMDMVSNIGKFTAQGQELEKSVTAMEGISTWAALSGAGITGASRAMYNLSQALGMGSVRVQDWMSVENANMATKEFKETVMETARELGKLDETFTMVPGTFEQTAKYSGDATVSVANFRTTLSAGWFDTEVLMGTLQKYGDFTDRLNEATEKTGYTATEMLGYVDKFKKTGQMISGVTKTTEQYIRELSDSTYDLGFKAFKAAQEATTFKQAIDSIKDASSTAFMTMFETVFGNYEKAKRLWTDLANGLYEIFVDPLYNVQETLSGAFTSGWDNVSRTLSETGIATDELQEKLIAHAEKYKRVTREEIEAAGGFYESLQNGWLTVNTLKYTLRDYVNELSAMSEEELAAAGYTQENIQAIREYQHEIGSTTIDIQSYVDELKQMSEEGRVTYTSTQIEAFQALSDKIQTVDGDIDDHIAKLSKMSDAQLAEAGYTREEVYQLQFLRQKLGETEFDINSFLDSLDKRSARDNFIDAFWVSFENLKGVIDAVKAGFRDVFPAKTSDDILAFSERVLELSKRIKIFDEESGEFTKTGEQIRSIFRGVASVFSIVKTIFSSVAEILSPLTSKFGGLGEGALGLAARIGDAVTAFAKWLEQSEFVQAVTETLRKTVEFLVNTISTLWSKAKPAIDKFASTIGDKFSQLGINFDELGGKFLEWINETELFDKAFEAITNGVSWAIDNFPIFIENVKKAWQAFRDNPLQWVIDKFNELKDNITKTINSIDGLKDTKLGQWFADLKINIQPVMDWLGEKLPPIFEKIKKAFTFNNAVTGVTVFYMIEQMIKTYKRIQNITKIGDSVKKAVDSIKGTFDSITGLVKTKTKQLKANNFLKYCAGIAIVIGGIVALAAEVTKLAEMPDDIWDKGSRRLLLLGGFLAAYQLIDRVIQLIPVKKGGTPIKSMTAFVTACVILSWEIDKLGKIDDGIFQKGTLRLGLLASFILAIQAVQKKLMRIRDFKAGSTQIGAVAAFIGLIVALSAQITLLGLVPESIFERGAWRCGLLVVFIGAVQTLEKVFAGWKGKNSTQIGSVAAFIGLILALTVEITALGLIPENVFILGVSRCGLLTTFLLAIQACQKIAAGWKGKVDTQMASVAIFVGLLAALGIEVKALGKIDPGVFFTGLGYLAALAVFLGALEYALNWLSTKMTGTGLSSSQTLITGLIGFVVALAALGLECAILGLVPLAVLAKGAAVVSAIALVLSASMSIVEEKSVNAKAGPILATALAMVSGITALGIEVSLLGALPTSVIIQGGIVVGSIAAVLAGSVALIEAASKNANAKAIIASAATVVIAIAALGAEVVILGSQDPGVIKQGGIIVSALVLALGFVMKVVEAASEFAGDNLGTTMAVFGGAVAAVAALALVAVAICNMSKEGAEIGKSIGMLYAMIGALALIVGIAAVVASIPAISATIVPVLLSVTAALVGLGVAALAIAGSISIAVNAIIALAEAMPMLKATFSNGEGATMLQGLVDGINNSAATILDGITTLLGLIIDAIIQNADKIGSAVVTLIASIAQKIGTILPIIQALLSMVIASLNVIIPQIMTIITTALAALIDSLTTLIPHLTALGSAVLTGLTTLVPQFINLVTQVVSGLITQAQTLLPQFVDLVTQFLSGLLEQATTLVPQLIELVTVAIVGILEAIQTLAPEITITVLTIITDLFAAMNVVIDLIAELITNVIDKICEVIETSIPRIVETGWSVLQSLLDGIANHIGEVATTALEIIANLLEGIAAGIGDVIQAGVDVVIAFIEGLADALGSEDNRNRFKQALKDLLKAGWDSLTGVVKDAADIGKNIIQGIKNGIENFKEELFGKMRNLASNALGAAKRVLGIESPSKAFMEVGKFVDLGFAKGIEKYEDVATVASEDMAMATLDTVSDTLGKMSDIIADNEEINPTITPILDLSEIQNGSRKLDSIFNNRSVNGTVSLAENISNGVNSRAAASYAQPSIGDLSSALSAFTANPGTSQTNTFNIYGDDPKAIADEVSVILAKQVERNRLAWA